MLIGKYVQESYLDPVELKFIVGYFLLDNNQADLYEQLIKTVNEQLIKTVLDNKKEGETDVDAFLQYIVSEGYITSEPDLYKLYAYVTDYCMMHTKEHIAQGYLDTPRGEPFIADMLRNQFKGSVKADTSKVKQVLDLFKNVSYTEYSKGFMNTNSPRKYFSTAYTKFFSKNYMKEISDIVNGKSNYDEEGVDRNSYTDHSGRREKPITYDVPNFTKIVGDIYRRSRVLGYSAMDSKDDIGNGSKVLVYDLWSCYKKGIVDSRFAEYKSKYSKMFRFTWDSMFKAHDINAVGYAIFPNGCTDSHTFSYRNYTSRENFVALLEESQYLDTDYEYFLTVYFNAVEGESKNNTRIFRGKSWHNFIDIFKTLKRGLKSVHVFLSCLEKNGIDPLSIPSDIFRDPAWVQRVGTLEEYLRIYKNVQSITDEELRDPVTGLVYNTKLSVLIAKHGKEELSNIPLTDLLDVFKRKENVSEYLFNKSHNDSGIPERRDIYFRNTVRSIREINRLSESILNSLYCLVYVTENLNPKDHVLFADIRSYTSSNAVVGYYKCQDTYMKRYDSGKIMLDDDTVNALRNSINNRDMTSYRHSVVYDWYNPSPDLEQVAIYSQQVLEESEVLQRMKEVYDMGKNTVDNYKYGDTFNERLVNAFRDMSVTYFVSTKLLQIYQALGQPYIDDLAFMDTIRIARDFIEQGYEGFKSFTNLRRFDDESVSQKFHILGLELPESGADIPSYQGLITNWKSTHPHLYLHPDMVTCIGKGDDNSNNVVNYKMAHACEYAYRFFEPQFDYLYKYCIPVVEEEDRYEEDTRYKLGFYENELMTRHYVISVDPSLIAGAKGDTHRFVPKAEYVLYKDAYYLYKGKPVTFEIGGNTYYRHKSGAGVNPKVGLSEPNAVVWYRG